MKKKNSEMKISKKLIDSEVNEKHKLLCDLRKSSNHQQKNSRSMISGQLKCYSNTNEQNNSYNQDN